MPTQKRLMESGDGETGGNDDTSHCLLKQPRLDGMDVEEAGKEEEEQAKPHPAPQQEMQDVVIGASERTDSDAVDAQVLLPEKPDINLHEIRKEVQCPICLGIIKRTRTMMECLHRFCRECIDKSMRLGNNECPACRTHCASRRSLRDDPRYDALIAALFPDIEKFEEEELAFHEEDKARNEQIQASIAQIYKRQSEALGKRPRRGSSGGGPSPSRSRKRSGETSTRRSNRRRRSKASSDAQESDDNDDITMAEALILSSATSEQSREITQQQPHHTSKVAGTSHSFSSATSSDGGLESSNSVQKKEKQGLYYGLMWNSEMRAWGKGGARSTARQSNANGSSPEKNGNRVRLAKLVNFLQSLDEEDKSTTSEAPAAGDGKADDVSEEVKKEHCIDSHDVQGTPQHFLPSMEAGKNHLSSAAAVRPCDSNNKSQQMPDMLKGKESFTSGFEANAISHGGQWIMAFQQKETS